LKEARGAQVNVPIFFQTNLNLIGDNVLCNNLSVAVTCEHANFALSPTRLQLIGGGGKLGEPGRSSPDTPMSATPKDLGAGYASSEAALLGTLMPVPCITKSHREPSVSSLGWGLTPSTLTLAALGNVPSVPNISCIGTSHASDVGSSGAGVSRGATTDHGEPELGEGVGHG
jgi:hypothetical protein